MPVTVYILNDVADSTHEERLLKHLFPIENFTKAISVRRSSGVLASDNVAERRRADIDSSQIVLLLVSPNFWTSCYDLAQRALAQKKCVVPVLVRDTMWREAEFGGLKPLPQNEKPIAEWSSSDSAWVDVIASLKPLWESLAATSTTAPAQAAGSRAAPAAFTPLDPSPASPGGLRTDEKLRVLFVTANPSDSSRLLLGEELRRVKDRVRMATGGERIQLIDEPEIRINQVAAALMRHRPHVVHFSGHGNRAGAIMLPDPSTPGKSRPVDPLALRQMLNALHDGLYCVVLNSCWSTSDEQQAQALADAAGCVVGVADTVGDDTAIELAASFYETLAFTRSFRTAFDVARANLVSLGKPEAELLRLYHRGNVDPARLPFAQA